MPPLKPRRPPGPRLPRPQRPRATPLRQRSSPARPPLTAPVAPGNISATPAPHVAFPSDVIDNSVLEAARERIPRNLADSPPAEPPEAIDVAAASVAHSTFVNIGFQMHAVEWGALNTSPLVLLHPLGGDAHNFDTLAASLQSRFHGFALDLRGHGETAWPPDRNYRLSAHVQDLDHFLQARGLSRIALITTGFGANIALAYAGARPDMVDHLVLSSPSPDPTTPGIARLHEQLQETPTHFDDLTAAAAWWRQRNPSLQDKPDSAAGSLVASHLRTLDDGSVGWKFDPALRDLNPIDLHDVDLFAAAESITSPTLIIRGTESDTLPS